MDSKINEGTTECSDLTTLLSTNDSVSQEDLDLIKNAKYLESPITLAKKQIYSLTLGEFEYVFSYGKLDDKRYLLEFKNKQYELSGALSLFE